MIPVCIAVSYIAGFLITTVLLIRTDDWSFAVIYGTAVYSGLFVYYAIMLTDGMRRTKESVVYADDDHGEPFTFVMSKYFERGDFITVYSDDVCVAKLHRNQKLTVHISSVSSVTVRYMDQDCSQLSINRSHDVVHNFYNLYDGNGLVMIESSGDSEINEGPFRIAYEEMTSSYRIRYALSILGLTVLFAIFVHHSLRII